MHNTTEDCSTSMLHEQGHTAEVLGKIVAQLGFKCSSIDKVQFGKDRSIDLIKVIVVVFPLLNRNTNSNRLLDVFSYFLYLTVDPIVLPFRNSYHTNMILGGNLHCIHCIYNRPGTHTFRPIYNIQRVLKRWNK